MRNFKYFFQNNLANSITSLYTLQAFNFIFPFLTLPYLTRVLGVEEYGTMVLAQSIALFLSTLIEYGFNMSATRAIALAKNKSSEISAIVSQTISAKFILTIVTIIIFFSLISIGVLNIIREYTLEIIMLAIVGGWNFLWFYRGIERPYYSVGIDFVNKICFTLSVFLFINEKHDGAKVVQLQIFFMGLTTVASFLIMLRWVGNFIPTASQGYTTIKQDGPIFLFKGLSTMHANVPIILLSYLVTPHMLGLFAGSIKLTKQMVSIISAPFWDAVYPKLSYSLQWNHVSTRQKKIKQIVLLNFIFGAVYALIVSIFTDKIVNSILGRDFRESIPLIKVLVLVSPVIAMNIGLINILLSQKTERMLNYATFFNIIIIIVLLYLFMSLYGEMSLAWVIVISEVVLFGEIVIVSLIKSYVEH